MFCIVLVIVINMPHIYNWLFRNQ